MEANELLIYQGKVCPYCGKASKFVDSKVVYGRSYGMIYLCQPCNAYCGVHKGTTKALGRLANKELRDLKIQVHAAFDAIWKNNHMRRTDAYKWLADKLEVEARFSHIGMMSEELCSGAIAACNEYVHTVGAIASNLTVPAT